MSITFTLARPQISTILNKANTVVKSTAGDIAADAHRVPTFVKARTSQADSFARSTTGRILILSVLADKGLVDGGLKKVEDGARFIGRKTRKAAHAPNNKLEDMWVRHNEEKVACGEKTEEQAIQDDIDYVAFFRNYESAVDAVCDTVESAFWRLSAATRADSTLRWTSNTAYAGYLLQIGKYTPYVNRVCGPAISFACKTPVYGKTIRQLSGTGYAPLAVVGTVFLAFTVYNLLSDSTWARGARDLKASAEGTTVNIKVNKNANKKSDFKVAANGVAEPIVEDAVDPLRVEADKIMNEVKKTHGSSANKSRAKRANR
jgi:hypothetical protein